MTIIKLSNGKRVANFSSPHEFVFEDNSILPPIIEEESKRLELKSVEQDLGKGDIKLSSSITPAIWEEMEKWRSKWSMGEVDVVFCPLPMILALYNIRYDVQASPFRAIRMEDRIKKTVSISKQCL